MDEIRETQYFLYRESQTIIIIKFTEKYLSDEREREREREAGVGHKEYVRRLDTALIVVNQMVERIQFSGFIVCAVYGNP